MKNFTIFFLFTLIGMSLFTNAQTISTFAGNGTGTYSGDGGAAIVASIYGPADVAIDNSGNIYIADQGNQRIRKVSTSGIISTIAGTGIAGFSGDGGTATLAKINTPIGIAVDTTGNIYFVDYGNTRVRKINTSGIISTVAGNGSMGSSGDGGLATLAKLYYPQGIAVDYLGNLYIADVGNYKIRKVNTSGIISTVAGNGTFGFSGDGGVATSAQLSQKPYSVEVDNLGNFYIADTWNHRIRKVNSSGIISTIAGVGTAGFSGDGSIATSAQFNNPQNICIDGFGNLYITDNSNQRIRKIDTSGIISTIAGNGIANFSGDGGDPILASLNGPNGIVVNSSGVLYIADVTNNRIRVLVYCTTPYTTTNNILICQGQTYTFNGHNYTVDGIYNDTLQTSLGCDSIITTNLIVNPTYSINESVSICDGQNYIFNGHTYTTAGIYNDTLQTINGCDSIIVTNLLTRA